MAVMWAASRIADAEFEVKEEAVGREASSNDVDAASTETCPR